MNNKQKVEKDYIIDVLTKDDIKTRSSCSCYVYMDDKEEEWLDNYKNMGEKVLTWYLKTKDEKFKEHMGIIVHM